MFIVGAFLRLCYIHLSCATAVIFSVIDTVRAKINSLGEHDNTDVRRDIPIHNPEMVSIPARKFKRRSYCGSHRCHSIHPSPRP